MRGKEKGEEKKLVQYRRREGINREKIGIEVKEKEEVEGMMK